MKLDKSILGKLVTVVVFQKIIGGEDDGPVRFVVPPDGPPEPLGPGDKPWYPILRLAAGARDPELAKIAEIAGHAIRNEVLNALGETGRAA